MSVQQKLQTLELLERINPASLLQILPDTKTPQDLEMVGYLMEKTPHDETLASAFLARSYILGLDVVFAEAYINTMLSSVMARAGLDGDY
ncbi:hypothetical protein EXS56_03295 [Candidatus Kaiserbacteria bacterium]|nr:hypothetical protein [Candidatus Kaiserbacteria bacterium]